ncbi:MAG: SH3 domain-containing protein [Anaerolineae bacterium]|nr:SH3 domain-containing protein [Anaerolineae bacterium]
MKTKRGSFALLILVFMGTAIASCNLNTTSSSVVTPTAAPQIIIVTATFSQPSGNLPAPPPLPTATSTDLPPNQPSAQISLTTWYINNAGGANVRACPSTGCNVIMTYNYRDAIQVIATVDGWHSIALPNNVTGYVAGFLTSVTVPPLVVATRAPGNNQLIATSFPQITVIPGGIPPTPTTDVPLPFPTLPDPFQPTSTFPTGVPHP